ncbi:TRAP transporter large permease [Photobacterium makurazakiensis]|uniref:TRAP transporter large permease n=1 Tax=Photobacterium makurazakiensis TaxID=2910234 RepID=UPI003D0AE05F
MFLLLGSLAVLLFLGVPIAYSLGISSFFYFFMNEPDLIAVLPQRLFAGFSSYSLMALPLFIFMGMLMNESGITQRLINFCMLFVGRLRGGLGLVNVGSSMVFGGISGSSTSDTASIGSILIPAMEKKGYPKKFSSGITVASSTMGMIIPPSIPMVLYAIAAQESVGALFLAATIPGLMIGLFQVGMTIFIAYKNKFPKEDIKISLSIVVTEVIKSSYVLVMPILIIGVVILGIATPTESSAIAVVYAAVIGFFLTRNLTMKQFLSCVSATVTTSSKIMMIIALSQLYIWVLALENIPYQISTFLTGLELSPIALMLLLGLFILAIGTFLDVSPAILILTPIFLPVAAEAGVSSLQFGVLLITGLAVGACTPPVGNCLNVCSAISKMGIGQIFMGALPFLSANVFIMAITIFFPATVLWLPSLLS